MLKTSKELRAIQYNEPETTRMLREGTIIKANTFDTAKGCYTIRIISYKGNLYFHKMLNGNIVELVNLTAQIPT